MAVRSRRRIAGPARAAVAATILAGLIAAPAHATAGPISASGIRMDGATDGDMAGAAVAAAGDVNGDGVPDMIIGAPAAGFRSSNGHSTGAVYVVYGTANPKPIALATLTPAEGFRLTGESSLRDAGSTVSGAGDVNGDGRDDILIGAPDGGNGRAYLVYGPSAPVTSPIDLGALTAAQGVVVSGSNTSYTATSVAPAGDVNGDGHPDVLVGAFNTPPHQGATYVIYGGTALPGTIDLSALQPSAGFRIVGPLDQSGNTYSDTGIAEAGIGDLNGDGRDDLVVSAPHDLDDSPGTVYVIYGPAGTATDTISLGDLTPAQGFAIDAPAGANQAFGRSLAGVGDVNGDGRPDILIGQLSSSSVTKGNCYLIYGPAGPVDTPIEADSLTSAQGFRMSDVNVSFACNSVATAGDQNGDGLPDLLIGEQSRATCGSQACEHAGAAFVIYGSTAAHGALDLNTLADADGYRLDGVKGDHLGSEVAGVGDVDSDGRPDILVGARTASAETGPGAAFLVLGTGPLPTPTPTPTVPPGQSPLGTLPPPPTSPAVKVAHARVAAKTVHVDRHGHVTIAVACPAGGATCTGSLALKRGKKIFLKAKSFKVAAGKTVKVSLTLSGKARRAVAARHKKGLKLTLVLADQTQPIKLIRR